MDIVGLTNIQTFSSDEIKLYVHYGGSSHRKYFIRYKRLFLAVFQQKSLKSENYFCFNKYC